MAYEYGGGCALDYFPCRYGQSKLLFRGPRRKLEDDYAAVLGGTETYGKFVEQPYPALLEKTVGIPVVNFGYMNAGTDVFVSEPVIIDACSKARVTVIQLMGAQNMSNRFYAVHPRRNDRFLRASTLMKTIFCEVDFTEFHFTRHMLSSLKRQAPDKYALVEEELKSAWVARMRLLLQKVESKTVLLWIEGPEIAAAVQDGLGSEPLLLDESMVAAVRPFASTLLRMRPSDGALSAGTDGMHFAPLDEPAAAAMPGPRVHAEVAAALDPVLRDLI
ncbi:hypothetical protein DEA8626_00132 [Defluviimonas aquaemixtae]|uniref:DUF6473 domain-containing protein n=1 Tax=Albidovulum aquaemixtae TaxID=1542388 RepID=A0A2R8B248_9RHOB|nr:DUF6473 family protein [Defluviimonas aquaemixtae]SPH16622.1 hypothetical protein DEA8626_00132 [Defluviimonas aquaemixtae]